MGWQDPVAAPPAGFTSALGPVAVACAVRGGSCGGGGALAFRAALPCSTATGDPATECTGLAQIAGQAQASDTDSQSHKKGAKIVPHYIGPSL